MFIFSYTAAVIAMMCVAMAAVILIKKRDILSRCVALYTLGVGVWNISNAFADISWSIFTARFWSAAALAGSMIFLVLYIIFLEQFLTKKYFKNRRVALLVLVPAITFVFVACTPLYIVEVVITGNTPAITVPGSVNYAVLIYVVSLLLYGLLRLRSQYQNLTWIKKRQILYVKAGFLICLFSGIIFTVVLPFFGYFLFFSLAGQFTLAVVILTAYSIFKHNFLDITIIIRRSVIFACLSFGIISLYLVLLFFVQNIFFHTNQKAYLVTSLITCLFGVFSVPKIDSFLRRVTDGIFFKDSYDPAEVLAQLSEILNKKLRLDDVVTETVNVLKRQLKIAGAHISTVFTDKKSGGEAIAIPVMQNISVVVPLGDMPKQAGALFLGPKLSGDPYTEADLDLLKTFSYQMTLALEKSRLYEQVKDYSKNLEEKIADRTEELVRLQEKQSQELFEIAHELQTPLTILKNDLHALIRANAHNDTLPQLEKNIDRVSRFINNLLRLAKMDFTEQIEMRPISLSDLLLELTEEFEVIAQESGMKLCSHIAQGVRIKGDRNKIVEMVSNLVSNAMKYNAHEMRVDVLLEKQGSQAVLSIADTGVGIAACDIPYIFDRFFRAEDVSGSGTGLGLAICKKIVHMHGGTIEVESEKGEGSRFVVCLPLLS